MEKRGRVREFMMDIIAKRFDLNDISAILCMRMDNTEQESMDGYYEDLNKGVKYIVTCKKV